MATERAPHRGRPTADEAALIGDRIVEAAWQVLLEAGPDQFAIDRVATAARASKQTIYARFAGKRDLLHAVLSARIGMLFGEMRSFDFAGTAAEAFAAQAQRAAQALTAPEALMLERLVDWLDAALTTGKDSPVRRAIIDQLHMLTSNHLERATEHWGLTVDDIPAAAGFWLDGIIGHIRGIPRDGAVDAAWPAAYARYFLRAVSS